MNRKSFNKFVYNFYFKFRIIFKTLLPDALREKLKGLFLKSINAIEVKKSDGGKLEAGVNLVGFIKAETGLGHGCRLLAEALEQAEINWLAINYDKIAQFRYNDKTWINKIEEAPRYNTNIFHINPDVIHCAGMYLPEGIWNVPYHIGFFLWELPELPEDWIKSIDLFDEIWAPSGFIVETIKKYTKKPVVRIPYGIELKGYESFNRTYFGFREDVFLFLVMFDVNSTAERKNPMGAVAAYKQAFAANDSHVGIVIKINNSDGRDEGVRKLKKLLEKYPSVYFIEQTLDRNEVNGLINSVDSFVSLHRSEGFGLVIAEAMFLGKPVIATNYSANTDFMDAENSCPVEYTMTTIDKDIGLYKKGQQWADADCGQAAAYMQRLVTDKQYYDGISSGAAAYIKSNLSVERSAKAVKERLARIEEAMR